MFERVGIETFRIHGDSTDPELELLRQLPRAGIRQVLHQQQITRFEYRHE